MIIGMSTRRYRVVEAERRMRRQLDAVLDDVVERRLAGGFRQSDVSAQLGCTRQWISEMERGKPADIGVIELSRLAAVVGLDLNLRAYAAVSVLRDAGQVKLLNRFCAEISPDLPWRIEQHVAPGDPRAFDVVLGLPPNVCAVEALSRLRDVQAQGRAALSKQQAAGVATLILLIAATPTNRRAIREAGAALTAAFPLSTRAVMGALRRGELPRVNGIVLL
jgi:transcriptional regulator with XRE-family HTH domain